jgi:hypothetical protein
VGAGFAFGSGTGRDEAILHSLPNAVGVFLADGAATGFVTDIQTVTQFQNGFIIQVQVTGKVINADAVVAHAWQWNRNGNGRRREIGLLLVTKGHSYFKS